MPDQPALPDLLDELDNPATPHARRHAIGLILDERGDPRAGVGLTADGLPDMTWCKVGEGAPITVEIEEHGAFEVQTPFFMTTYPITMSQFSAFIMTPDGWKNPRWWKGLAVHDRHQETPAEQRFPFWNHPRENVSWYEALAFCRWLSWRLMQGADGAGTPWMASVQVDWGNPMTWPVRLPTEMEWQAAATAGDPWCVYPWGPDWDGRCANTHDSGLQSTTAVGMYPTGASPFGVLDMCGNVWEWCLGQFYNIHTNDVSAHVRSIRGSSWANGVYLSRALSRSGVKPNIWDALVGFRCVRTR